MGRQACSFLGDMGVHHTQFGGGGVVQDYRFYRFGREVTENIWMIQI